METAQKVTWPQIWRAMDSTTRRFFLFSCASLLAAVLTAAFGFIPHLHIAVTRSSLSFSWDWLTLPWLAAYCCFAMGGGLLNKVAQSRPPVFRCSKCKASIPEPRYGCQSEDCNSPLCTPCFEETSEPMCVNHSAVA